MLQDHIIVGVHITDRVTHAVDVQNVLTKYGCNIKTRLGLHEVGDGTSCSPNGLVVLEFVGTKAKCATLCKQLKAITGVDAKTMTFEHS
jgi:hypothetical protein